MEISYFTKKWAAGGHVIVLAIVLVLTILLLYSEGGAEQLFSTIDSIYGIVLPLLIIFHYKKGWWSIILLLAVVTAFVAVAVHENPDVTDVVLKGGSLHAALLYFVAVLSVDIYCILHKPQITVTDKKLVLNFGRTTVEWQTISEIRLDKNHLRVEKKEKRLAFIPILENIETIAEHGALITTLSEFCYERDIPFSKT